MVISEKMQKAINEQINAELYSSYLYLSMSAYFYANNYKGFGRWFEIQSKEENEHAMKLYHYLLERGGKVELKSIGAPKIDFKSHLEVVEETYNHELKVTSLIYGLLEVAKSEKDYATEGFLQWFVKEQVEEEANSSELVEYVKMCEGKGPSLMMLDAQLGKRDD